MLLDESLDSLAACAAECELCPRMIRGSSVLSERNGNPKARVLFIAEAPGRLGAHRTQVPLHGDKTGDNFEHLLGTIGWRREDIFITNAVLCNPQTEDGLNDKPSDDEIHNCSIFLTATIRLVDPAYIVTLGAAALRALSFVSPHRYELKQHVRRVLPWRGCYIIPLYHPGPRAVAQRSLLNMESDFQRLKEVIGNPLSPKAPPSPATKKRKTSANPPKNAVIVEAVAWLIDRLQPVSLFRLHKLLYLAEVEARETLGQPFLGIYYIRQKDGPFAPDVTRAAKYLCGMCAGIQSTHEGASYFMRDAHDIQELTPESIAILESVVTKFGKLTNPRIKVVAYRAGPMRDLIAGQRRGPQLTMYPCSRTSNSFGQLNPVVGIGQQVHAAALGETPQPSLYRGFWLLSYSNQWRDRIKRPLPPLQPVGWPPRSC